MFTSQADTAFECKLERVKTKVKFTTAIIPLNCRLYSELWLAINKWLVSVSFERKNINILNDMGCQIVYSVILFAFN